MNWTASTSTLSGGRWLIAGATNGVSQAGTAGSPLDVRVDTTGLAVGSYFGQVQISAAGVDNSPQSATVVLSVLPANRAPGPVVDPLGMLFTSTTTGAAPATQTIRIANISDHALSYTATLAFPDQRTWFTLAPTNGSILPGSPISLEVRPVLQTFPAGVYRGQVNLRFTPDNINTEVNLILVVAGAGGQDTNLSEQTASTECKASRLALVFKSPGSTFNATAGWPVPIELLAADDCGKPFTAGQATVSFSNGDPPVALVSTADGRWSGTWAARNIRPSITLTARAIQSSPRIEGTAQVSGNSTDNPEQPVILPGGVLNAASRKGNPPVSPGAGIVVTGSKFAQQQQQAPALPLPTQIGNTTAFLAGQPIPLRMVSEGRLEAVTPFTIADSTVHQLVVRRGNTLSLPEPVVVAAVGPAAFAVDESGYGQGQVFVAAGESGDPVLADASHPARGGEHLSIWCTGLGVVNSAVSAGEAAPSEAGTRAAVQVTIQGATALVDSAVLAPGLTGVYLVSAVVPDGLTPDASAPLVIGVNGQSSPVVTIAIP